MKLEEWYFLKSLTPAKAQRWEKPWSSLSLQWWFQNLTKHQVIWEDHCKNTDFQHVRPRNSNSGSLGRKLGGWFFKFPLMVCVPQPQTGSSFWQMFSDLLWHAQQGGFCGEFVAPSPSLGGGVLEPTRNCTCCILPAHIHVQIKAS